MVGAKYAGGGQPPSYKEGRVSIYLGGPGGLVTGAPYGDFEAPWFVSEFGAAVASAGDVNSDGFSDVIVGSHYLDYRLATEGRAYLYFGGPGPTFDGTAEAELVGRTDNFLGDSVAGAGDVNGDGFDDVVIGTFDNDADGEIDPGRAEVYFGGAGATFDATLDVLLTGDTAGLRF